MSDRHPATEAPPLPPIERLLELFFDAARGGRDDMIPALLQAGVDIESLDPRGHSALILASYHGHSATTALLLSLGAKPDGLESGLGNTALMGVAFKGYEAIAEHLIASGADVDRRNSVGQTAVMMAALFGHVSIVDLLINAGAEPTATDAAGNNASSLARAQGNMDMAAHLERASVRLSPK